MGLPLLQPVRVRSPEAIAAIAELRPDLGVLADYGQIIPPTVLAIPPHGILNVHPSALPRHRGASPIAATIAAGDPAAAVTLIQMDEGLDSGPVVASESWPLDGTETAPELEAEAARRGAALLVGTIDDWIAGRRPALPQADIGRQPDASAPARGRPPRPEPRRGGARAPGSRLPALARQLRGDRRRTADRPRRRGGGQPTVRRAGQDRGRR